jgi:hypothetical protein
VSRGGGLHGAGAEASRRQPVSRGVRAAAGWLAAAALSPAPADMHPHTGGHPSPPPGDVVRAPSGVMHGKTSPVHHTNVGILEGLEK